MLKSKFVTRIGVHYMEDKIFRLIGLVQNSTFPSRDELVKFYNIRLDALGMNPVDASLPKYVIHVAGTKGKGSTCAFCESILRTHGLRTGLFTSPHLVSINERFRINGEPVETSTLEKSYNFVHGILSEKSLVPHYFGFLLLLGFHIFSQQKLDVLILEVGLGGRLDATNIIERPTVCGISLLDLDHTEILGDTIEQIAREKGGIIKKNVPLFVSCGQEPKALHELNTIAENMNVKMEIAPEIDLPPNFPDYQRANAGLAVQLCRSIIPDISDEIISQGITATSWPGRAQILTLNPSLTYFLDGAHTPKSIDAAVQWFKSVCLPKPTKSVLLFNCMHSRDPVPFLRLLNKFKFDHVIFSPGISTKATTVQLRSAHDFISEIEPDMSLVSWQETLVKLWKHVNQIDNTQEVTNTTNLADALDLIEQISKTHSTQVFTVGSLLLVGDTIKLLKDQ